MDLDKLQLMIRVCKLMRYELRRQIRLSQIERVPSYGECAQELYDFAGTVALRVILDPDEAWDDFFSCIVRFMTMDKIAIIPVDEESSESVELFSAIAVLTPITFEDTIN